MKKTLFLITTLIFSVALPLVNSFAQDWTRIGLPEGAKARLGKGQITDFAFSPDGARFAVASSVGVWIHDAYTYQEFTLLTGHTNHVNTVAFSPDGVTLASGGSDNAVRLWDIRTGDIRRTLLGHTRAVTAVAFSPDGRTLVSAGYDETIRLWNPHTGQLQRIITKYTYNIEKIVFSPDGNTFATLGENRSQTIRLWDFQTGEPRDTLSGRAVAFSPDQKMIASVGDWKNETIRLWDFQTGELRDTFGSGGSVLSIAFSPDGNTLVTGNSQTIQLWNTQTGNLRETLTGSGDFVAFSPDGRTLASGNWRSVQFWNSHTGQRLKTLTGFTDEMRTVAFSPDGVLLASGGGDDTIRLWNTRTEQHLNVFAGHTATINSIAFSPDGSILASGSSDNTICLWDLNTGKCVNTFTDHTDAVLAVAFSPDGKKIASGGSDYTIRLWDVRTGQLQETFRNNGRWTFDIAFSPDGKKIASGGLDGIWLRDAHSGEHLHTLTWYRDASRALAFSPDGSILVGGGSTTLRLWDAHTGERLKLITGHIGARIVNALAFSPNGRTLASASWNWDQRSPVYLWDVRTSENRDTHHGHTGDVNAVAFSPDGTTLASASSDGTILLWHVTPDTETKPRIHMTPTLVESSIVGEQFTLNVNIMGGKDVVGYQLTVDFDATALRFVSSTNGDYLPRDAFVVSPSVNMNSVSLVVTSLTGGNTGDGTLTTLTYEVIDTKPSIVALSEVSIVNSAGERLDFTTEGPCVIKPLKIPTDVNGDGSANIADLTFVAARLGHIGAGDAADVNDDGVVNILDLVAVAAAME